MSVSECYFFRDPETESKSRFIVRIRRTRFKNPDPGSGGELVRYGEKVYERYMLYFCKKFFRARIRSIWEQGSV